jgi:hypothetical protein
MKKVKTSNLTSNNSNITLKLLKMKESKPFTTMFKNEVNGSGDCEAIRLNENITINMTEKGDEPKMFEKSNSTKSSNQNESKSSSTSDTGIEGSVNNEKPNSSKSSIESNESATKNFFKINDSKSFSSFNLKDNTQTELDINKSLYSQVNVSKNSNDPAIRNFSLDSIKLNENNDENKQSIKSMNTQLLNDNLDRQNSVLININSTPRASAIDINCNRNSKICQKILLLQLEKVLE